MRGLAYGWRVDNRRLKLEGTHLALTCLAIALVWRDVALCTGLLAALTIARFALRWDRLEALVFGAGFVFASLAEIVQVACGLYTYAQASPLVIPAYNLFLWGAVLCFAYRLMAAVEARLATPLSTPTWPGVLAELAGYSAVTALLCLAGHRSLLVAAIFAAILIGRLLLGRAAGDGWFVLLGVLLGPAVEASLVGLGIYRFADPRIAGLPLWHPIYWAIIALFLRRASAFVRGQIWKYSMGTSSVCQLPSSARYSSKPS